MKQLLYVNEGGKLKEIIKQKPVIVSIDQAVVMDRILYLCAIHFNISIEQIKGKCRKAPIVKARHCAYWMARHYTKISLINIGYLIGGRDHTTVMHGVAAVNYAMEKEIEYFYPHIMALQSRYELKQPVQAPPAAFNYERLIYRHTLQIDLPLTIIN